jgi:hypothetical protein
VELGAKMVPFAGYAMPVQYRDGILAEHRHTRSAAGLFDVSHMGQLRLVGEDAAALLETLVPVDIVDLPVFKQRYALFTNEAGGILDDLMVCRRPDDLFVVVNAGCKQQDTAHLQQHLGSRVIPSPERALLALLQGPQAVQALARLAPGVQLLTFMDGGFFKLDGFEVFLTRSGYTGEDGFEISVHERDAIAVARSLLDQPEVKPIGLGARDTLRLEAGLCLYGHDIDTPHHAGRGRADLGHPEGAPQRWRARRRLPRLCRHRPAAAGHAVGAGAGHAQARRPDERREAAGARRRQAARRRGRRGRRRHQRHARARPADTWLPWAMCTVAAPRRARSCSPRCATSACR